MKYIVLALMSFGVVISRGWLQHDRRRLQYVGFLIGFSPFFLGLLHINMALISWAGWPGYVKGIEVSIVDFLVLATFLSLPRSRHPLPFVFPMAAYFAAALLSVLQSGVPMASLFYCWQLLRMFFLYRVLSSASEDRQFAEAVLKGLGAAVIVQAFVAGGQHFALRVAEAHGTTGSKNELGMMTDLVVIPAFALLLSGRPGRFNGAVVLSALIVAVSTGSRAAIGLGGLGYAATFALSLLRQWTPRKAAMLLAAAVVAIVVGFAAYISLSHRTAAQFAGSDAERAVFEHAAAMILGDHPLGVGANEYVVVVNIDQYNTRAGVPWDVNNSGAIVHNIYWLMAAETGYFGLVTYVVLLASCLVYVFRRARRYRNDRRGDLLMGIAVSFSILYVHGLFEWVSVVSPVQYVYCILLAVAVGISNQLAREERMKKDSARLSARSAPVARAHVVGALCGFRSP